MDHCENCSFYYDQLEINEIPGELRSLGSAYRSRLEAGVHDAEYARLLRRRPMPQVWSALEYSCHFRDVLLAQRERVYLALVEDTPRFGSIYRDERVVLTRYNDDSLDGAGREVDLAASLAARAFARLDDVQWQRRCVYGYPAPAQRTVVNRPGDSVDSVLRTLTLATVGDGSLEHCSYRLLGPNLLRIANVEILPVAPGANAKRAVSNRAQACRPPHWP